MFQKQCPNCEGDFNTKDRRQVTCSAACAAVWRKKNPATVTPLAAKLPQPEVVEQPSVSLPSPEELPAPYAKRVYDMWRALIGEVGAPSRIA